MHYLSPGLWRAFALASALLSLVSFASGTVRINELVSSNGNGLADEDGDRSDWIELHNTGPAAVDLTGWGLSDSAAPFKWTFPAGTTIGAGAHLIVWASSKDRGPGGNPRQPSEVSGLVLWLDANQAGTTTDNTALASWPDRSGLANHVTQATSSRRPRYRTGVINGLPAISFDGATQDFNFPNTTFAGMSNLADFTVLALVRWNGKVISGIWGTGSPGTNTNNLHFEIRDGGLLRARHGNLDSLQVPGAVASGAWNVLSLTQRASLEDPGLALFRNGAPIGTYAGSPGTTVLANYQGFVLGNSHNTNRNFEGHIAEFILFNRRLPDEERRGVEAYLNQKYKLGGSPHTNFAISAGGEAITLTRPDGTTADQSPPVALPRDIALGRAPGQGDTWFYFDQPTPGAANTTPAYVGLLDPPTFSHAPGFRTAPHPLAITHADSGVTLRYTLDGSRPTASSPVYTGPLTMADRSAEPNTISQIPTNFITGERGWQAPPGLVRKGNVVRVRAERPGHLPAYANGTYFVFPEGAGAYSVPVISISTDAAHLFDSQTGIYVPGVHYTGDPATGNYYQTGGAWERPAEFEFFETDGHLALRQGVGLRIHGGFTRRFPQKTLRIYARSEYGASELAYPFFPDEADASFKRLILRPSGNDWGGTMFRDATAQTLIRDFNVDTQAYRPAVVFLNGEYWGIHNIRERYDKHYLARTYGVDPENIDYLSGSPVEVDEGDALHYNQTLSYILAASLADESRMDHVRTRVDLDNFIDYYSAQIYFGNNDWPGNNIDYWRARVPYDPTAPAGRDGRWRWLLYDVDRSLGHTTAANFDMIAWTTRSHESTRMFRAFLQNPGFRDAFLNRMADHLNSAFVPSVVAATVDRLKPPVQSSIAEHIARWSRPTSVAEWQNRVNEMYAFAADRPGFLRQHLISHFSVGPARALTIAVSDPAHGTVRVNSLTIDADLPGVANPAAPYPWTGIYFQQVPVTVQAMPAPGFRFAGWQGRAETTDTLTLQLGSALTLTALFEVDPDAADPRVPAPHSLASGSYTFTEWPAASAAGTYPPHMVFQQTAQADPALATELESLWTLPYNIESRSRINGLDAAGVSFINTGNTQEAPEAGFLGSAVVALDTRHRAQVAVTWTGGTVAPNNRIYALRLQYRLGDTGPFTDVLDALGAPVEYQRATTGHSATLGPVTLPAATWDQPYVQLRWKYHAVSGTSGARPQLRLDDILVTSVPAQAFGDWKLLNFPNPADRADPLISGPLVDLAGDGAPNLLRYALDAALGEPASAFLPEAELAGDRLSLRFARDPAKRDITYRVEASSDLAGPWSETLYDSDLDSRPNNDGAHHIVTDTVPLTETPRRFLRLRVNLK